MDKKEMMGVTFNGTVTFNGPMFDIHDNEHVTIVNDRQRKENKVEEEEENAGAPMPDVLASEEAMRLWDAAREAGWVDEHYQPLVSRTKAAVLADHMAGLLGIGNKWKVFEKIWKRNNMRGDYNDALDQKQYGKFLDKMKKIIC